MAIFASGISLIVVAAVLDSFFRLRMARAGHKWTLFAGGAFDYRRYHKEGKQRGWSAWPVYAMWGACVSGMVLLIAGFFAVFGTSPIHRN
jgi:hypothetical protein